MNDAALQVLDVVEAKLSELVAAATTDPVKVKLRNIDEVCKHLVVTGKQRLTVPSLLSAYAVRYPAKDQAIAESSIRNKRAGGNPYQDLYRAWESAAEVLLATSPRSAKALAGEVMNHDDLAAIPDLTVRHQVKLLIAQNKSLKSQLDILRQVRGAPVLRLEATHPDTLDVGGAPMLLDLTESEVAAIEDFLAPNRMKGRGLSSGDDGVLEARGGKELSDPGFLDALRKVILHVREGN